VILATAAAAAAAAAAISAPVFDGFWHRIFEIGGLAKSAGDHGELSAC
jgi:hypothetical protein